MDFLECLRIASLDISSSDAHLPVDRAFVAKRRQRVTGSAEPVNKRSHDKGAVSLMRTRVC